MVCVCVHVRLQKFSALFGRANFCDHDCQIYYEQAPPLWQLRTKAVTFFEKLDYICQKQIWIDFHGFVPVLQISKPRKKNCTFSVLQFPLEAALSCCGKLSPLYYTDSICSWAQIVQCYRLFNFPFHRPRLLHALQYSITSGVWQLPFWHSRIQIVSNYQGFTVPLLWEPEIWENRLFFPVGG